MASLGIFCNIISADRKQWEEEISSVKNLEPDHIELMLEHPISNSKITRDDVLFLRKELRGYSIIVHAPFNGMSIISSNEFVRKASLKEYRHTIDMANKLDARVITIHAGIVSIFRERNKVNHQELLFQAIEELLEYNRGQSILAIENGRGDRSYPIEIKDIGHVLGRFKDLEFTMDTGHLTLRNIDVEKVVEKFFPRIANIHMHDVADGKDHRKIKADSPNIRVMIPKLKRLGYQRFLTVEVVGKKESEESFRLVRSVF